MAEPQIITTLTAKRNEIEGRIEAYEREIERCKIDLAAVEATLCLFQSDGTVRPTMSIGRMFKRGEAFKLVCEAIEAAGKPLDTRELAEALLEAKGFDSNDRVMRKAVAYNIIHTLKMRAKRGQIQIVEKRKGVMVWATTR